jgi:hypothetical protein
MLTQERSSIPRRLHAVRWRTPVVQIRPLIVSENSQQLKCFIGSTDAPLPGNAGFPPFPAIGTLPANLAGMADGWSGRPVSGRQKMTFNLNSLQHIAVSAIGAIFAATLFITAAVGPAGQII